LILSQIITMKYPRLLRALIETVVMGAVLCSPVVWAQAPKTASSAPGSPQNPGKPLPPLPNGSGGNAPLGPIGSTGQGDAQSDTSGQVQPDTHALAGGQFFGLGSLRRLRNLFDPALQVSESGETGILPGKTLSVSRVGGSLGIEQHQKHSDLTLTYNGAESFYQPSYYNGIHTLPYQDAAISQNFYAGRWILRLRDDVLYSWGPGFGSLFAAGPAQAGENSLLEGIQPSLAAVGTIQTALARQLSNTTLGEIDYAHSRRTTLTLLVSYGIVNFLDPGYINSQNLVGRVGYNYALSAKNSFALSYEHNRIIFIGSAGQLQTDLAQMEFGRKVTGRLAFQLAAGPQLIHYYYFATAKRQQLSWSATGSLTYQWRRSGYSLSYFRGVTAGSGVLFGSSIQTVTATARHDFTKTWSASMHGGYALNKSLASATLLAYRFDDWFAGANLSRPIGRQFRLELSYGFQQQTTGNGLCPVLSCGLAHPFSEYGVTLGWHPLSGRSGEPRGTAAVRP